MAQLPPEDNRMILKASMGFLQVNPLKKMVKIEGSFIIRLIS